MKPPKFFEYLFKLKKTNYDIEYKMIFADNSLELIKKVEEFTENIPKGDIVKINMGRTIANIGYKVWPDDDDDKNIKKKDKK